MLVYDTSNAQTTAKSAKTVIARVKLESGRVATLYSDYTWKYEQSSTRSANSSGTLNATPTPKNAYSTITNEEKSYRSSNKGKYIRGPRGGCYYINSSGRKVYVDRSLCD